MLRYYDPAFLDAMAASVCARVADFEDTHLASVLFAYASFGAAGPPDFLPTLAREVSRRRLGLEIILALLLDLVLLGTRPSSPLLTPAQRPRGEAVLCLPHSCHAFKRANPPYDPTGWACCR